MNRKIILTTNVNIYRRHQNDRINNIFKKFPLIKKILERLPQKWVDYIFVDDYYVTERIFEKGFVFMNMAGIPHNSRILDVGCLESDFSLELSSLGYDVWGIDINDYPLFHPNFKFVKGSICKTNFEDNFFDVVVAISTLEHIGLGWYGDSTEENDLMAVKEIKRILKKNGLFIMTVPFGLKRKTKVFRVYDSDSLNKLINGFEIVKVNYFVNFNDKYWCISTKEEAEKQDINTRGRNGANVCLVLKNIK